MRLLQGHAAVDNHHLESSSEYDGWPGQLEADHTDFELGKRLRGFARRHYSHQNQPVEKASETGLK